MSTSEGHVEPYSFCEEGYLRQIQRWGAKTYGANMYVAFRVRGAMLLDALEEALNDVIAGQESLRANFSSHDGKLVKTVVATRRVAIERRDRQHEKSEAVILDEVADSLRAPFDLAHGPLIRALCLVLDPSECVVVIVIHHVVFDAGSTPFFLAMLSTAYEARARGEVPALPPVEVTASDFAKWQTGFLTPERREALAKIWEPALARCQPIVDDLVANLPPRGESNEPGHRALAAFAFDEAETAALVAVAGRHRTSMLALSCAGFAATLRKVTKRDDITFMYLHNLRSQYNIRSRSKGRGIEGTLGNFVAAVPFHLDFSPTSTTETVLAAARAELAQVSANSDVPIRLVSDSKNIPRLYAIGLNYQRHRTEPSLAGVTLERIPREAIECKGWSTQLSLELRLEDKGTTLGGSLVYDTSRWSESTMDSFALDLRRTLLAFTEPTPGSAV